MMRAVGGCAGVAARVVGVALVALAGHACAYGELAPLGHGYLAPYRLAVALCSLIALAVMAGALALAWASRWRPGLARVPRALFGRPPGPGGVSLRALALARDGLIVLCGQETLERSVALRRPAGPAFTPTSWLLAIVALGLCGLLVALVTRVCASATRSALARLGGRRRSFGSQPRPATPVAPALGRRVPLAERRGLRAPPLPAG